MGESRGAARSFICQTVRGKRKGSRRDWSPAMCGRRRPLALHGRAIAGAEEGRCAGEKKGKKGRGADTRGQCAMREESGQRLRVSWVGQAGGRSGPGVQGGRGSSARFCEQTHRSQRWEMTSGSHPSVGGRGGNKVGWPHHRVSREERLKCLFAGGRCMLGITCKEIISKKRE